MAFLELVEVTKSYGGKKSAVENVNVAIESGEFFCSCRPIGMRQKHDFAADRWP